MLKSISVNSFKSLWGVGPVTLAPFTVLFGPNAVGKSNFLDAIQLLSRLATERTVAEALSEPIRGQPLEAFSFPPGGLPKLLAEDRPTFDIEADIGAGGQTYRYRVAISVKPKSGALSVADEYLAELGKEGKPKGSPQIEQKDGELRIRRKSKPAHPRQERLGEGHTQLSDRRYAAPEYAPIERVRRELSSWRSYYLDPRIAMRASRPPQEVEDIGPLGERIAPFLYWLRQEHPKRFQAVGRALTMLIPSIESLTVDLDEKRGVLDIEVVEDGTPFSSRIVSEGTLRVIALASVASFQSGGLITYEEPENGVHPRRIEMIAEMLAAIALNRSSPRQVLVTTHSPLFCGAAIRLQKKHPELVSMFRVSRARNSTTIQPFTATGDLAKRLSKLGDVIQPFSLCRYQRRATSRLRGDHS